MLVCLADTDAAIKQKCKYSSCSYPFSSSYVYWRGGGEEGPIEANPSILSHVSAFLLLPLFVIPRYLHCSHSRLGVFILAFISWTRLVALSSPLTSAFPSTLFKYASSDKGPSTLQPPLLFTSLARLQRNLLNVHVRFAKSVRLTSTCNNSRTAGGIFMKFGNMKCNQNASTSSIFFLFV
jgi:hypothetical protein